MSQNPFAPPEPMPGPPPVSWPPSGYPSRGRRRWPSWLIVTVSLVCGLVLVGLSSAALFGLTSSAADRRAAARSSGAAGPAGSSEPGSGSDSPGSSGSPLDAAGDQLSISFPDGSDATFTLPDGTEHDGDDDGDGHVSIDATDSGAALDVYADESSASDAGDLHRVATDETTGTTKYGGQPGPPTFRTVGGRPAAQFLVRYPKTGSHPSYEALVTVVLSGRNLVSIYWSDELDYFDAAQAETAAAALVRSLKADESQSGATDLGST